MMDTWDHSNGLPGTTISALLQSRDGYLWIGTGNGLARFDGVRFVTFDRRSHPKLLSNRIRTLFEDSRGRLWIGTEGGGVSILANGTLTTRSSDKGIPSDYVRAIAEDSAGNIWIGTDGEGLCILMADTILRYDKHNSILDDRITSLVAGNNGSMWVGTYNGLFKHQDNTWARFTRKDGISSDTITCMVAMGEELWFGTFGGGVTILRDGRFSIMSGKEGLPGTTVMSLAANPAYGIHLTTIYGGVSKIHGGVVSSCKVAAHDRGEHATAVLVDLEGDVWVGLQDGKLVRLRDASFTWFPSMNGQQPDPVRSVFQDNEGTMWAGTASCLRRLQEDVFVSVHQGQEYPINILSVGEGGDGTMWVGSLGRGLHKVDRNGFTRIRTVNIPAIWALYTDESGTLWAGTNRGVVSIKGDEQRHFFHDNSRLSHDDVRAICRRADGSLWVGTSYGLNTMQGDSFVTYTKNNSAISNNVIIALHADTNGDLWVGTQGGLNRLHDTTFVSFTVADGLPGDEVGQILEDNLGYFWIVGEVGLYRVGKKNLNRYADGSDTVLHCVSFGKADGILDPGISATIQPSAWKSQDGRLWFATNSGVAMVDPKRLRLDTTPPTMAVERIIVDQREVHLDSIPALDYTVMQIAIDYTAPCFIKPEKMRFKYRLRELKGDWIEAGTRRTAYFTHIPPGEYTFEVMAVNALGVWSTHAAMLPLTILPPFWMTWWFHSIVVFLFLSVGPVIYFRRVSQLKKRHSEQLEFSKRLIASQEAERKRIAAELHDSLGQNIIIIKNRALLGKQAGDDKNSVSEQLDEIASAASATLDDMRKIAYNLRPLNLERFGLTDTIAQTVSDVSKATGVVLEANIENIDKLLPPEAEIHFFRIIQEALNNMVKHALATNGSVSVRVVDGTIHLVIIDNGRGFDPAADSHARGFGLDDIAQRAHILGGELTIDSTTGKGTTVTVKVPAMRKKT